tara:strand:- start:106 stop:267 length:162 start_codon:yes stop_codon:yes gene_type:complete
MLPSLNNRVWGNARAFFYLNGRYALHRNFAIPLSVWLVVANANREVIPLRYHP